MKNTKQIEEKRKIPLRNYLILGVICIVTITLTLYINAWIKTYKVNKTDVSPLIGSVQQININELDVTLAETNQIILYVGNNENYDLDNSILKRINKDGINEIFYYLNIENSEIGDLKSHFGNVKNDISKIPMLIYIKNGIAEKVLDSKSRELNVNDLNVLIDSYINAE